MGPRKILEHCFYKATQTKSTSGFLQIFLWLDVISDANYFAQIMFLNIHVLVDVVYNVSSV